MTFDEDGDGVLSAAELRCMYMKRVGRAQPARASQPRCNPCMFKRTDHISKNESIAARGADLSTAAPDRERRRRAELGLESRPPRSDASLARGFGRRAR